MLQEFAVNNETIVTSYRKIVIKSHAWHIGSLRVLRRLALMTDELDIPWDPSISFAFNRDDAPLSTICTELSFSTADPSWRLASPILSCFRCDALILILRPLLWLN